MNQIILLVGVVIMICVLMGRVTSRLAVPSLLIFIGLGMLFGEDGIFVMILRGEEKRIPNGDTQLLAGDLLILAAPEFTEGENLILRERTTVKGDKWSGKTLKEVPLSRGTLVVSVRRGEETLIPAGDTRIQEGDTLIIAKY